MTQPPTRPSFGPQYFGPQHRQPAAPWNNPYAAPPGAPQGPGLRPQFPQAPFRQGPDFQQAPQFRQGGGFPQGPAGSFHGFPPQPGMQGRPPFGAHQPGPNPGGPPFHQGQYPPAYPWPQPKKKSGSAWWLALPLTALALMVGYFFLTQDGKEVPVVGPDVEYVNEEYQVPGVGEGPAQIVDSLDKTETLTDNPLYEEPVPRPVRCEAAEVDDVTDRVQMQKRMNDLNECLTRNYGPALESAGFEAYRPRVLVYDSEGNTPCGELRPIDAFYCGANQGIYLSAELYRITGKDVTALDYVMAHEYSHNVQGRNGVLVQRLYEQEKAKSENVALEWNRRLETQADCLAATFISSVSDSMGYEQRDFDIIVRAARSVGDDQGQDPDGKPGTHGVADSRGLWTERGLEAETFGDCNTFVAPSSEVR